MAMITVLLFPASGLLIRSQPLAGSNLSIPAEYLFSLNIPGALNQLLRPGKVYFDREAREVYVADKGHGRILIFDEAGTFKFEFPTTGYCGSVIDFAVSTDGIIYVLGTTREGADVFLFDFDGTYLRRFTPAHDSQNLHIISLALDPGNHLYLLDQTGLQILAVSDEGRTTSIISLLQDLSGKERHEASLGALTINDDTFIVPVSSMSTVIRVKADGTTLPSLGYSGGTPGEMAFPVAVAVTRDGMIMVLDKQRFNVLCFAQDGTFMGEFGGKGVSLGWFYYPSWIAVDSRDHVYISQVFQNRVQACQIPEPIRQAFLQHGVEKDFEPPLQSITPDRHPRSEPAQDRKPKAVETNRNVTRTPTQLWEV